jgi:hypothetical protein
LLVNLPQSRSKCKNWCFGNPLKKTGFVIFLDLDSIGEDWNRQWLRSHGVNFYAPYPDLAQQVV